MIFWISIFGSLFCILKIKKSWRMNLMDLAFLLFSWQIFNLGIWQKYIGNTFPIEPYYISALILIAFCVFYIKNRGINLGRIGFSLKDFWIVCASLAALFIILLPIGLKLNFLKFNPKISPIFMASAIFDYIFSVALAEELIFRGIILNLLKRNYKNWFALACSSLLFAVIYTHFCGGGKCPNFSYMGLAFIAGMVYGISYLKSSNILVPILVHGLTDSIWRIFFS